MEAAIAVPKEIRDRVAVAPPEDWVKQREVDFTAEDTEGFPVFLLDEQYHASLHQYYKRLAQRLETRKAIHQLGQWRLDFDPRDQRVVIHSLRVVRDGVPVEHAQPERFRFLQRETSMEWLRIDGLITLMVVLEDVRVGDVIDASYTIHTTPVFLKDRSSVFSVVPTEGALQAYHLSVRFPSGRAMRWKSNDKEFAPAINQAGTETEWSWTKEKYRFKEHEANVPAWHFTGTWVQVTDCVSWGEVASEVASAWQEDMDAPEFADALAKINASAQTPLERANQAITLVQDEIRYLFVTGALGGRVPARPGSVLRRRYGDCKDKSFLLVHLLRHLGLKAWPVLVHTQLCHGVEQLLPSPGAFNHVIVKYELEGQTRWVDATIAMQGGGALDRLVPDYRVGLPLGPEVTGLDPIPQLPRKDEKYELREAFSLDSRPGHPSVLNVSIRATGVHAEELRGNFANLGQDGVARNRETFYRQLFSDLQRSGAIQWEDDRVRNEFKLTESFDVHNAINFQPDGKTCIFQYYTHRVRSILGIIQTGKRNHPYALPYPCNIEHSIEVETSNILDDSGMAVVSEKGAAFRLGREYRRRGNRAIITYALVTLADSVPPAQFEMHRRTVNAIWQATTFYFRFPRGLPAPQRRHTLAKKTRSTPVMIAAAANTGESAIPRSNQPIKKVPIVHIHGSKRRKGEKRSEPKDEKPAGPSRRKILIAALCILALAAWWVVALLASS